MYKLVLLNVLMKNLSGLRGSIRSADLVLHTKWLRGIIFLLFFQVQKFIILMPRLIGIDELRTWILIKHSFSWEEFLIKVLREQNVPGDVWDRKISSDCMIKTLGVVRHMVKIPNSFSRFSYITVPHLRNCFAPNNFISIWLQHDISTGCINNLKSNKKH